MEKQFRYDFQTAVVETDKGLVHGYEYDGMSIFKGIPYARSKRFHDPEPVEPWDGLREATGYGLSLIHIWAWLFCARTSIAPVWTFPAVSA